MKCQEMDKLLVAYLDNEVTPSERTLIQAHLAGCERCQEELAALSALQSRVSQFLQFRAAQAAPSPQAWSRLQARLAGEARLSPSWLPTWLQRLAPGGGRINQIFEGGITMKKGFALAAIAALVIAFSAVAFIPSVRAQVIGWVRARWEVPRGSMEIIGPQPGYTVLVPSYLPDVIGSASHMVGVTSMGDDGTIRNFFGDPDGQWLQISQGPAPADKALPAGQEVTIGGQKGVLITGLSGTLELVPPLPEDVQGTPPADRLESFAYQDAQRLVWDVGGTRVEILSNLPVEEMLKVAESFVPAETGEGEPPLPQPPVMPEQSEGGSSGGGVMPLPTPEK
jgi:hypothetical protein